MRQSEASLTKRYSQYFDRNRAKGFLFLVPRFTKFLRDVWRDDKFAEAISFLIWEFLHFLKPRWIKYLNFSEDPPLTIPHRTYPIDPDMAITRRLDQKGLHVVRDPQPWKLMFISAAGDRYGCLDSQPNILYKALKGSLSVRKLTSFDEEISAVFVSSHDVILACAGGTVYRGSDNNESFVKVLQLTSPLSSIWFGNGITELPDGTIVVGEYGNICETGRFQFCGYMYISQDSGQSWERSGFLKEQGTNKHIHVVRYSHVLDALLLTDGDNRKRLWIGRRQVTPKGFVWSLVNRHHIQMGGYISILDTDKAVLLGTDYVGGANWIVRTSDGQQFTRSMVPDPYRRNPIAAIVGRSAANRDEIWSCLHSSTSAEMRCLLMCSLDGGATWERLIEYDGTVSHIKLISRSGTMINDLWFSVQFADDYRVYHVSQNRTSLEERTT